LSGGELGVKEQVGGSVGSLSARCEWEGGEGGEQRLSVIFDKLRLHATNPDEQLVSGLLAIAKPFREIPSFAPFPASSLSPPPAPTSLTFITFTECEFQVTTVITSLFLDLQKAHVFHMSIPSPAPPARRSRDGTMIDWSKISDDYAPGRHLSFEATAEVLTSEDTIFPEAMVACYEHPVTGFRCSLYKATVKVSKVAREQYRELVRLSSRLSSAWSGRGGVGAPPAPPIFSTVHGIYVVLDDVKEAVRKLTLSVVPTSESFFADLAVIEQRHRRELDTLYEKLAIADEQRGAAVSLVSSECGGWLARSGGGGEGRTSSLNAQQATTRGYYRLRGSVLFRFLSPDEWTTTESTDLGGARVRGGWRGGFEVELRSGMQMRLQAETEADSKRWHAAFVELGCAAVQGREERAGAGAEEGEGKGEEGAVRKNPKKRLSAVMRKIPKMSFKASNLKKRGGAAVEPKVVPDPGPEHTRVNVDLAPKDCSVKVLDVSSVDNRTILDFGLVGSVDGVQLTVFTWSRELGQI
ncbi:hypothetical protein TeGR_g13238, partial [Tetraparma gracilis]